jgi:hypothetical protein
MSYQRHDLFPRRALTGTRTRPNAPVIDVRRENAEHRVPVLAARLSGGVRALSARAVLRRPFVDAEDGVRRLGCHRRHDLLRTVQPSRPRT